MPAACPSALAELEVSGCEAGHRDAFKRDGVGGVERNHTIGTDLFGGGHDGCIVCKQGQIELQHVVARTRSSEVRDDILAKA